MPPSPPPVVPEPIDVAGLEIDPVLAAEGRLLYAQTCVFCHGGGAVSGGKAPDLRASPVTTDRGVFAGVVRRGRQTLGMPGYLELGDRDIDALFHYVRQQARQGLAGASH